MSWISKKVENNLKYTNTARGIHDFASCWPLLLSQATIYGTIIMVNDRYFDSIVQCLGVLRNVQVYCAMSMIKIDPYEIIFWQYCAMSGCIAQFLRSRLTPMKWTPNLPKLMHKHWLTHFRSLAEKKTKTKKQPNLIRASPASQEGRNEATWHWCEITCFF